MSSVMQQIPHSPSSMSSAHPRQGRFDPTLEDISELEQLLHHTLAECNKLAKSNNTLTHEVTTAKMLNYCIRMLHADGWHPPTIVRAMALRETGLDKGMRGTMHQALRERRQEIETYHLHRAMVPDGERGSYSHARTGAGHTPHSGGTGSGSGGSSRNSQSGRQVSGRVNAHGDCNGNSNSNSNGNGAGASTSKRNSNSAATPFHGILTLGRGRSVKDTTKHATATTMVDGGMEENSLI